MSRAGRRIALCSLWRKTRKKFTLKASLVNIVTLRANENRVSQREERVDERAYMHVKNNGDLGEPTEKEYLAEKNANLGRDDGSNAITRTRTQMPYFFLSHFSILCGLLIFIFFISIEKQM